MHKSDSSVRKAVLYEQEVMFFSVFEMDGMWSCVFYSRHVLARISRFFKGVARVEMKWLLLVTCIIILVTVVMEGTSGKMADMPWMGNQGSTSLDVKIWPLRKLQEESSTRKESSVVHSKQEVRHIGFLKVHKAASSTMQNMFFRFGRTRNLTFVFTTHPNYFSRDSHSHLPLMQPRLRKGFDILCNHGAFNYTIYSSILPKDTDYVAIVRDPLDLFISSVNYYSQKGQAITYIVKTPRKKIQNLIRYPEKYDRSFFSYTRNCMARDFGFEPRFDKNYTSQKLTELGRVFKLVMLVEYFEESLILLKRYLNWRLQDILFLPNNVNRGSGESVSDLTPSDLLKFRTRNSLDYDVYEYFYQKFWVQFNAESLDIHREVLYFKQVLKMIQTYCNGDKPDESQLDVLSIEKSAWNDEFSVSRSYCELMQKDELVFISELRRLQGSELPVRKSMAKKRLRIRRLH